jgi:hypothetical protein
LGQKLAKTSIIVGGRIIVRQEKISRAERSWIFQLNALQEAIPSSSIKFCIYCFSLWYEFFVHYALNVEKYYQYGLDAGLLEFQFLRPRRILTNPFRNLWLYFWVICKTPGLISRNNFVKKLSASAIAIMSWQDEIRSSLNSRVKESETRCAHNFLFLNSSFRIRRNTVLGMFKNYIIILDAIRKSFLNKSATIAIFTSVRVDC